MVRIGQIAERIALLTGAGLIVAGVHQIHAPSALIVAGAMLAAAALWRRPPWPA